MAVESVKIEYELPKAEKFKRIKLLFEADEMGYVTVSHNGKELGTFRPHATKMLSNFFESVTE